MTVQERTPAREAQRLIAGLFRALLTLLFAAHLTRAQEPPKLLLTIPQLSEPPTIDGTVTTREWAGASILPPLVEQPGSLVRNQHTRIHVGWRDANLYFAVQYRPPGNAKIMESSGQTWSDLKTSDHLELAMTAKSGASLILWPNQAHFVLGDQPVPQGWSAKVQHGETAWEAEAQIPLAQFGLDPQRRTPLHVDVTLLRPTLGMPAARLSIDLVPTTQSIAVRFLEGGPFVGGTSQGVRGEIVNGGSEPIACMAKATFSGPDGSLGSCDQPQLMLPGDSARRVQLATPLIAGRFTVDYNITTTDGQPIAVGAFAFESGGALQIEVVPFFLWRDGIFVKATLPEPPTPTTQPTDVQLSARLLDSNESAPISHDAQPAKRPGNAQLFLGTKDLPAGVYVVEVTATQDGKPLATQKQRVTKPEIPAWWKSRQREHN